MRNERLYRTAFYIIPEIEEDGWVRGRGGRGAELKTAMSTIHELWSSRPGFHLVLISPLVIWIVYVLWSDLIYLQHYVTSVMVTIISCKHICKAGTEEHADARSRRQQQGRRFFLSDTRSPVRPDDFPGFVTGAVPYDIPVQCLPMMRLSSYHRDAGVII